MTKEELKKQYEINKLKKENELLRKKASELGMDLSISKRKLDAKIIKEVNAVEKKYNNVITELIRQVRIAEDLNQRLEKKYKKLELEKDKELREKDAEIFTLKRKLIEQAKELDLTKEERDKYLAELNLDGTTSSIPTSQTPINKKKVIPNTRVKSGKSIGGQPGHKKHTLEAFKDSEVNETVEHTLKECSKCGSKNLKELEESIIKDELDYEIRVIKRRHYFKEYECLDCHNIVRENIPKHLKEENQYGSIVQAHALALNNVANVPINKVRRIISGLTSNEINLSEGYISKLQKRTSDLLEEFNKDLKQHILILSILHWDDAVIFVNGKRSCLRSYCDEYWALYKAHEHKNKAGLDEDGILSKLPSTIKVVHDHNTSNYNSDYVFVNVECCIHLERDLERVKKSIVESTWSEKLKELFSSYNTKRNEYLKNNIDSFSIEETDDFMIKFDEYLLLGVEENKKHGKSHYYKEEKALLNRLMKYRDNYTYWLFDFSIPYTNNTAERSLRIVKTKMKVSGQFQNIEHAKYYANIKSYIETCYRHGINEIEALSRLLDNNPYTIQELIELEPNDNIAKEEKQ